MRDATPRQPMKHAVVMMSCLSILVASVARGAPPANAEPTKDACVDANENAQRLQRAGKVRDAAARFRFCTATSCPAPVRDHCGARLAEIDRAMPTVIFEAVGGDGETLVGVTVTVNGMPLTESLDGSALPIDPGTHRFVFQAPGAVPVQRHLTLREGEKGRRERIVFTRAESARSASEPRRTPTGAYIALGLSGAGLVVGALFTGLAVGEKNKCSETKCTEGVNGADNDSAVKANSAVAITGFSVGAVALVVGIVLLTSGDGASAQSRSAPRIGISGVQWNF